MVSILIEFKEFESRLLESLESILDQKNQKWEILIGTDGFSEFALPDDKRIKVVGFTRGAKILDKLATIAAYPLLCHMTVGEVWSPDKIDQELALNISFFANPHKKATVPPTTGSKN